MIYIYICTYIVVKTLKKIINQQPTEASGRLCRGAQEEEAASSHPIPAIDRPLGARGAYRFPTIYQTTKRRCIHAVNIYHMYVHIIYIYMLSCMLDVLCVITNLYLRNYVYTNIRRVIFFVWPDTGKARKWSTSLHALTAWYRSTQNHSGLSMYAVCDRTLATHSETNK